jgi:hypothetical protein
MRDSAALRVIGPSAATNFAPVLPLDAATIAQLPPTARAAIAAADKLAQDPTVCKTIQLMGRMLLGEICRYVLPITILPMSYVVFMLVLCH